MLKILVGYYLNIIYFGDINYHYNDNILMYTPTSEFY